MNKMIVAVVPRDLVNPVLEALVSAGFTATYSESRGGVMCQAQEMLFIAVDEADLQQVLALIRSAARGEPDGAAEPAGVALFIWQIDQFETL